ncbi:uncharacterized protein LOC143448641 [Clavelina lepadiformis]|uniref:Ska2 N-terminal domain-containing protein n=1 Tax=Clavelina lepadiformis TaxID=159417 RepID=A0ABP0H1X7_CLALP
MEEAMENVVKKFEDAERNLLRIEGELERGFEKTLAEDGENGAEDKASLMQKLNEIKQDYANIKEEAQELGKLQREMALAFQQELFSTVQKLQALTDKQTASQNSSEAAETAVESLVEQSIVAENLIKKLHNSTT